MKKKQTQYGRYAAFIDCAGFSIFDSVNRLLLFLLLIYTAFSCEEARVEDPAASDRCSIYHDVHFALIDSLPTNDRVRVLDQLASLSAINGVDGFSLTEHAETKDPRALKEVDVSIRMCFSDGVSMNEYRVDPRHIQVKKEISAFLKAAPIVIDSRVFE
ncbi:MAG: Uncharacterised protein [Flavobacteriia bacterium]|nr:MAG: Uncharacterised protein [Flavobacteriia bacterium]